MSTDVRTNPEWILRAIVREDTKAIREVIECMERHLADGSYHSKDFHPMCCIGRLKARLADSDRALAKSIL